MVRCSFPNIGRGSRGRTRDTGNRAEDHWRALLFIYGMYLYLSWIARGHWADNEPETWQHMATNSFQIITPIVCPYRQKTADCILTLNEMMSCMGRAGNKTMIKACSTRRVRTGENGPAYLCLFYERSMNFVSISVGGKSVTCVRTSNLMCESQISRLYFHIQIPSRWTAIGCYVYVYDPVSMICHFWEPNGSDYLDQTVEGDLDQRFSIRVPQVYIQIRVYILLYAYCLYWAAVA